MKSMSLKQFANKMGIEQKKAEPKFGITVIKKKGCVQEVHRYMTEGEKAKRDEHIAQKQNEQKQKEQEMLNICDVTGKKGIYGEDIKAAKLNIERNGVIETFRLLVHKSIKSGRRAKGGKVKSVIRKGMRAAVKHKLGQPYVVITG